MGLVGGGVGEGFGDGGGWGGGWGAGGHAKLGKVKRHLELAAHTM